MHFSHITDDLIIDTIKEVVAEKPDHVYTTPDHMKDGAACYYAHTDPEAGDVLTPGCVVGAALHRLGVPLETLREYESMNAWYVLRHLAPGTTDVGRNFASDVQGNQDDGETWGAALALAEKRLTT